MRIVPVDSRLAAIVRGTILSTEITQPQCGPQRFRRGAVV
jgi:hypothetical protein